MDIEASRLTEFSNRCLEKAGVPEHEAQIITSTMIEADARGINSHGLMRLPIYIQRIQKGLVRPLSHVVVERDHQATAVLDANYSAGQIAGTKAMDLAISKAKTYGVGAVSVKNSNHFGIAAHYALKASRNNMIGIVMSNTAPLMPPTGGAEKVLGNNPLSIAVPSNNEFPLLIDMALSNAALGKILFAQTKGWGADRNGKPTTDPSDVLNGGFILPAAGPKGFGLALMIELMTGVLGDTQFSKMIPSMYDLTQPQSISHFMLAINIAHFMDMDRFTNLASVLSSYVKHAVKAEGVQELYLPGEIEFRSEEKKMKDGIPVLYNVLEELNTLALSLQVPELKQI
jgi:LDH2 family malate/lactate/ureidoglycolate dehydrogenase